MVALDVNFEPCGDFVLLEEIKVTETPGGLHLPDSVEADGPAKARVIKVGPGRYDNNGNLIPMPVQAGDLIYTMAARVGLQPMKVPLNGREYIVLSAGAIIAKCH